MFYPELGGMRLDSGALIGLALALAGTLSFCIGNMLSLAAQRRKLPIFASTGWSMVYGAQLHDRCSRSPRRHLHHRMERDLSRRARSICR